MIYNDYDLIITNNYIKEEILKAINLSNTILKPKIITKQELKSILIGNVSNDSIFYLMNKYNLEYNHAKLYVQNIYFNNMYYEELIKEGLIYKFHNFNYKNMLLINEYIDPYLIELMNNPKINYYKYNSDYKNKDVYEFNNIHDEIYFIGTKIMDLIKNQVSINEIKIVNINDEYINILRNVFLMLGIPINVKDNYKIYKTKTVSKFLNDLESSRDVERSLKTLPKNDIYFKIINILNRYNYDLIDDNFIKIIREELKNATIRNERYVNAVECINMKEIYNPNYHYFIINFNEGSYPRVYKDDDYYNDYEKNKLGLFQSVDKTKQNKEIFNKVLNGVKNVYITYKLNSDFNQYFPSYLINDFNLNVIKDIKLHYNYSDNYNKIILAKKLDDYINYNVLDDDLKMLYYNYKELPYKTYSNAYKNINKELYLKKHDYPKLSYTSLNNYFLCPFKYYLTSILKLDDFEESIQMTIGNLFHNILEKIYEKDFNFDDEFNNFIKDIEDKKTLFFLKILKDELKFIIETINNQEKYTSLKNVLNEEKIEIDLKDAKVYGIIDKVLYENIDGEIIGIIIDYKTGTIDSNLNNIEDGLNLQLPIYAYLKYTKDPNFNVSGIYYQEILHNYDLDKELEEKEKGLKLQGYSISDVNILKHIDSSYINSNLIMSMKVSSKGFYPYTKVMTKEDFNTVIKITEEQIQKAKDNILNRNFVIEPKSINNKNISCTYCPFKDICFYTNDDIKELPKKSLQEILRGRNDG